MLLLFSNCEFFSRSARKPSIILIIMDVKNAIIAQQIVLELFFIYENDDAMAFRRPWALISVVASFPSLLIFALKSTKFDPPYFFGLNWFE